MTVTHQIFADCASEKRRTASGESASPLPKYLIERHVTSTEWEYKIQYKYIIQYKYNTGRHKLVDSR